MADRTAEGSASGTRGNGDFDRFAAEDEAHLEALAARRARVGAVLTAVMLVVYFGFILLIAFDKEDLGELLTDGLSVGMLLGIIVVLVTWVLTWIYVGWANRRYEPEIQRLKAERRR